MKRFLAILGLTAIFWFSLSMSEQKDYMFDVKIVPQGFDTVRYAVAKADSVVAFKVRTSGFHAFVYSVNGGLSPLQVEFDGDGLHRAVGADQLCGMLDQSVSGVSGVEASIDSVRLDLAKRTSRTYQPLLDKADFSFEEQYGLYGRPEITPAEVELFGPAEQLDKIKELHVKSTSIQGIKSSGTFTIDLDPVWEKYVGVRPSCTSVQVYLPVEAYVERQYKVPITVANADTAVSFRFYPEQVTVHAWVARRDLHRDQHFVVEVDYADIMAGGQHLTPRIAEFPDCLRPRRIEPSVVQCIVLK